MLNQYIIDLGAFGSIHFLKRHRIMTGQVFVMCLTWHCNKFTHEEAKGLFEQASKDYAKKWIFQLERGKEGSYHIQGTWDLHKKDVPKRLARVLNDRLPGVEISRASDAGKEALRLYCTKDETRVAGPWMDPSYRPPYRGEDLPKVLWPWQQQVVDEIKGEPNDRKIVWIYDGDGCVGKSKLCKYIMHHKIGFSCSIMSMADTMNLVVGTGPKRAYLFDIPRTKTKLVGMAELYHSLENIKNGTVVSGKYQGNTLVMDPPHVYVFSNYLPDKEAMSKDRWEIRSINKDIKTFM